MDLSVSEPIALLEEKLSRTCGSLSLDSHNEDVVWNCYCFVVILYLVGSWAPLFVLFLKILWQNWKPLFIYGRWKLLEDKWIIQHHTFGLFIFGFLCYIHGGILVFFALYVASIVPVSIEQIFGCMNFLSCFVRDSKCRFSDLLLNSQHSWSYSVRPWPPF